MGLFGVLVSPEKTLNARPKGQSKHHPTRAIPPGTHSSESTSNPENHYTDFGVYGLGFRVWDIRVKDLGFKVQGLGLGLLGLVVAKGLHVHTHSHPVLDPLLGIVS